MQAPKAFPPFSDTLLHAHTNETRSLAQALIASRFCPYIHNTYSPTEKLSTHSSDSPYISGKLARRLTGCVQTHAPRASPCLQQSSHQHHEATIRGGHNFADHECCIGTRSCSKLNNTRNSAKQVCRSSNRLEAVATVQMRRPLWCSALLLQHQRTPHCSLVPDPKAFLFSRSTADNQL